MRCTWSGPARNDFWNALGTNPTATDVANCTSAMRAEWAGNLASAVDQLHAAGAENFLVLNLPPLGNTPRYLSNSNQAAINAEVVDFNNQLFAGMTALENTYADLSVQTVDTYGLFNQIVADPGSYGLDNVTDPAMTTTGADPDKYLFWDDIHPTAAAHALLAQAVAETIPEPGTLALLAAGAAIALLSAVYKTGPTRRRTFSIKR